MTQHIIKAHLGQATDNPAAPTIDSALKRYIKGVEELLKNPTPTSTSPHSHTLEIQAITPDRGNHQTSEIKTNKSLLIKLTTQKDCELIQTILENRDALEHLFTTRFEFIRFEPKEIDKSQEPSNTFNETVGAISEAISIAGAFAGALAGAVLNTPTNNSQKSNRNQTEQKSAHTSENSKNQRSNTDLNLKNLYNIYQKHYLTYRNTDSKNENHMPYYDIYPKNISNGGNMSNNHWAIAIAGLFVLGVAVALAMRRNKDNSSYPSDGESNSSNDHHPQAPKKTQGLRYGIFALSPSLTTGLSEDTETIEGDEIAQLVEDAQYYGTATLTRETIEKLSKERIEGGFVLCFFEDPDKIFERLERGHFVSSARTYIAEGSYKSKPFIRYADESILSDPQLKLTTKIR